MQARWSHVFALLLCVGHLQKEFRQHPFAFNDIIWVLPFWLDVSVSDSGKRAFATLLKAVDMCSPSCAVLGSPTARARYNIPSFDIQTATAVLLVGLSSV